MILRITSPQLGKLEVVGQPKEFKQSDDYALLSVQSLNLEGWDSFIALDHRDAISLGYTFAALAAPLIAYRLAYVSFFFIFLLFFSLFLTYPLQKLASIIIRKNRIAGNIDRDVFFSIMFLYELVFVTILVLAT